MEYTRVEKDAITAKVRRDYAMKAELQAYVAEVNAEITGQNDDVAKSLRSRATQLKKKAKLNAADVKDLKRQYLERWLTAIENDHFGHSLKVAQKEEDGLEGPDPIDGVSIEEHKDAIIRLEHVHKLVTARLEKLR